jgi:hypothetical protein
MFLRLRIVLCKRRIIRLTRRVNRLMGWLDDARRLSQRLKYFLEKWEEVKDPGLFLRLRIRLLKGRFRLRSRRYARVLRRTERISARIARATDNIAEFSDRLDARLRATTFLMWLKAGSLWFSRRWERKESK